ncbi:MAG TPA: methyltransferase domain-containing protein [Acidimicrobiia bacterium]|nr:methyltransferase domain-containing protein [Acidimicrobiia bacterium]
MEVEEYARIAAAEDDHWWYRNTRALMADLLRPWLAHDQRILDAGCGPGGNGAWLRGHGQVVGVDVAHEALEFVRTRRAETVPVRASAERLPFEDGAFDVAVGITLLYTVPNDVAALAELARVLRTGGAVLLLEPAFESLRRGHDVTVHGLRRYRRHELAGLAARSGLRVRRATYAYSFLAPPAAVLAKLERRGTRPPQETGSDVDRRVLDPVFAPLAQAERRWLTRHDVAVGTSVVVLATRD